MTTFRSTIKRHIPSRLWSPLMQGYLLLRRLGIGVRLTYYSLAAAVERFRRSDVLAGVPMPPRSLVAFVGGHDFTLVGEVFKRHFVDLAHLRQDHKVLDVGCGVGRVAVSLTSYLSPDGEYWGFDVAKSGVQWCRKEISPRYPNFHFEWCDVYNKVYNQTGKQHARGYTFPFDDNTFDFVFAVSVFTHMLPNDLEHYLAECSRVLKSGGKCLATFFLLNVESRTLMAAGSSTQQFAHEIDGCWLADRHMPEAAVAYEESLVRQLYEKCGFSTENSIYYGSWCDRASFMDYQDMIIATRR